MRVPLPPKVCNVYTPEPLAKAMVQTIGDHPKAIWLEPCVGKGAFLNTLSGRGIPRNRIFAIDLSKSSEPSDSLARTLRGTEFLSWSLKTTRRFDRVVANPPYINLDHVPNAIKKAALKVRGVDGKNIRQGSNCWAAFLSACVNLLNPGGSLCFLLPSAWDYANYAAIIREQLPKQFRIFEVHRSREPLFETVRDGCVVLIARGYKQTHQVMLRSEYEYSAELIEGLNSRKSVSGKDARVSTKAHLQRNDDQYSILGDIIDIRLGGVTGDSKYFLLTESERAKLKLPVDSLRPVLSRSRHLISSEITEKEWGSLRANGERVWLFDPPPRTLGHPAVSSYIKLAPEAGGCHQGRVKIEGRKIWYRTMLPRHVDGFISGMTSLGPWIAFCKMPRLTASNTLYTVEFRKRQTKDEKAAWAISLLISLQTRRNGSARIYPEGLCKYEPGDLLKHKVSNIPRNIRGAQGAYRKAVKLLQEGRAKDCKQYVRDWFNSR